MGRSTSDGQEQQSSTDEREAARRAMSGMWAALIVALLARLVDRFTEPRTWLGIAVAVGSITTVIVAIWLTSRYHAARRQARQ